MASPPLSKTYSVSRRPKFHGPPTFWFTRDLVAFSVAFLLIGTLLGMLLL